MLCLFCCKFILLVAMNFFASYYCSLHFWFITFSLLLKKEIKKMLKKMIKKEQLNHKPFISATVLDCTYILPAIEDKNALLDIVSG